MPKFLCAILLIIFTACSTKSEKLNVQIDTTKFKSNCQIKILNIGRDALLQRIQLIRSAKKSIDIQTFIWTNDQTGQLILQELIEASKKGVKVRILCDHLFSVQDSAIIAAITQIQNLEIKIYNPAGQEVDPNTFSLLSHSLLNLKDVNQRMHNKLILVDSTMAISGGRNIEDTYFDNAIPMSYKDLDLAVKGEVCNEMAKNFEAFWQYEKSIPIAEFQDIKILIENNSFQKISFPENPLYEVLKNDLESYNFQANFLPVNKIAFFSDAPGKNESQNYGGSSLLNEFIVQKVESAQRRIWIQTPYVVLSDRAIAVLEEVSKKKINLKISTNSLAATDSWPTYAFLYKQKKLIIDDLKAELYELNPLPEDIYKIIPSYNLLLAKMKVEKFDYEIRKNGEVENLPKICLHTKCMIIDNDLTFVGSYNLDPRSANLNTEQSLVIIDEKINKIISKQIADDIAARNSWVVARQEKAIGLQQIEYLLSTINDVGVKLTSIDLWPNRYTASYNLLPGKTEVPIGHPDFYKNYESLGNFPRMKTFSQKELFTRLFKAFAHTLKPIM